MVLKNKVAASEVRTFLLYLCRNQIQFESYTSAWYLQSSLLTISYVSHL